MNIKTIHIVLVENNIPLPQILVGIILKIKKLASQLNY